MVMGDASTVLVSGKIGPVHLGRNAYVYVRQSTLTQLREHTESLIRQYELRERAVALGWDPDQVSGYDLTCRFRYDLTCRSRQGDHVMGSPPATRVRRSLRR
jgi:hypothetical protein